MLTSSLRGLIISLYLCDEFCRCHSVSESDEETRPANWTLNFDETNVTLVGFSKGCVVLNQFIREFHFLRSKNTSAEEGDIVSRIKDMYFLDGGHAGREGTWVTDSSTLRTFAALGTLNVRILL